MRTPWGRSDGVQMLVPEVYWVTTPSHGGFLLKGEALDAMTDYSRTHTFTREPQWYEEDVDWALVVIDLWDYPGFREKATVHFLHPRDGLTIRDLAIQTLKWGHPEHPILKEVPV